MRVALRCSKQLQHRPQATVRRASTFQPANRGDDSLLRQVFDTPSSSWRKNLAGAFRPRTGLLKNGYLSSPEGFPRFATDSLHRARFLTSYISQNHAAMTAPQVVKAFDRLSDTLCSVLDLAEFVRNSHPDAQYTAAAEHAYGMLHGFMNNLNTHTGLFAALSHITSTPERLKSLNSQEAAVLDVLLADFYRSGVHLDDVSRSRFVTLSTRIAQAERRAFTDYGPAESEILLPVENARGLWPSLDTSMMTADGTNIKVPTTGWQADSAMQRLELGESRMALLQAMQKPRRDQVENMDDLFRTRGELAKVVGQDSYGSSILAKQMAKSPQQVEAFLTNVADGIRPRAQAEIEILAELKRRHLQLTSTPELHRWDEDYYSALHVRNTRRHHSVPDLSPYLSVGTVIQGLSRLFEQLYGVRFVPREMQYGEAWHSDVRRLDVVSDGDGLIGTLYCDLFSRPGKDSGLAAHFTVRCGRRIDDEELLPGEQPIENGMLEGTLDANDGSGRKRYQLPVIALQCDFTPASPNTSFASLSFHEVHTLFHEMGHAIHSMLGTTDYQTISGTRVAADFVELPSQIMESFAESSLTWSLFARHHASDEIAPLALRQASLSMNAQFPGLSSHRQCLRSVLDQRYHSHRATLDGFNGTRVLRELEREYRLHGTGIAEGEAWQVGFTHLSGYGGTYYSYSFDKAIADRIYAVLFERDPVSRTAGEKFKREVLRFGGSRDPWACLAGVLDDGELARGDTRAMEKVGEWARDSHAASVGRV